jgi:anti-anti-sigma factor
MDRSTLSGSDLPAPVRFDRSNDGPGHVRVAVTGEIDFSNSGALRDTLATILGESGLTRLELDFAGVRFVDSSGIDALVTGLHSAQQHRVGFAVRNAGGTVLRVMQIVGVDKLLAADGD